MKAITVGEMVGQMIAKLGENISVRRFVRFKVGEIDGRASPRPPLKSGAAVDAGQLPNARARSRL